VQPDEPLDLGQPLAKGRQLRRHGAYWHNVVDGRKLAIKGAGGSSNAFLPTRRCSGLESVNDRRAVSRSSALKVLGGDSVTDQANKMANSANNQLRKTCNPVNVASVRRYDHARATGTKVLEKKPSENPTPLLTLLLTLRNRRRAQLCAAAPVVGKPAAT
jgi:hypothetical protein